MKKILFILCISLMVLSFAGMPLLASGGKVNINTATAEELCGLRGIGPAYAKAIVEYRVEHGDFKSPEEIIKVKGIGEKIFNDNKDSIVVKENAKQ